MSTSRVFRLTTWSEFQRAGPTDLVELDPIPGREPLFVQRNTLRKVTYGLLTRNYVHLSGPSGSGKTALLESLGVPGNFQASSGGMPGARAVRELRLYPVPMVVFEAPGELYSRRALVEGATVDEPSILVTAMRDAQALPPHVVPAIWLREIGRVHTPSIQSGLLDLMVRGQVSLPWGETLDASRLSWVCDSNYQAVADGTHTLVPFDDALKARLTIELTLDYLPADQDVLVLERLMERERPGSPPDRAVIEQVVRLGHVIRRHRAEGQLLSTPPPNMRTFLTFLRMHADLGGECGLAEVATSTLLGNVSGEDRDLVPSVLSEVFGVHDLHEDPATAGALI